MGYCCGPWGAWRSLATTAAPKVRSSCWGFDRGFKSAHASRAPATGFVAEAAAVVMVAAAVRSFNSARF